MMYKVIYSNVSSPPIPVVEESSANSLSTAECPHSSMIDMLNILLYCSWAKKSFKHIDVKLKFLIIHKEFVRTKIEDESMIKKTIMIVKNNKNFEEIVKIKSALKGNYSRPCFTPLPPKL